MVTDIDIYRSANVLIRRHGDAAATHAAMMADKMMERGDCDGKAVWVRVMKAVEVLTRMASAEKLDGSC